jgi:hypothetical protein
VRQVATYIITPLLSITGGLALDIGLSVNFGFSHMFCGADAVTCPKFPFTGEVVLNYLLFLIINFLLALLLIKNWKKALVSSGIYLVLVAVILVLRVTQ